jgi:predicted GIY-YIG superfamily endonuclease
LIKHPCGATYIGCSIDPVQRLRCHNGEISGGARYTLSKGPGWVKVFIISSFDKRCSMRLEWSLKHPNVSGLRGRVGKAVDVLNMERFTSKAGLTSELDMVMHWFDEERFDCLNNLPSNVSIIYENEQLQ